MSTTRVLIDIETQRTDNPVVIKRLQDAVKPPGQYKKADSIAQWYASEGAAARLEAVNRTALDGTYGRLATVGFCVDGGPVTVLGGPDITEFDLLKQIQSALPHFPFFVAFNGEFDFRFLMQRAIIQGVRLPHLPLGRGDDYFDPMKEWAGYRGYIKQQELEEALGFVRQDPLGSGADVGEAIDAGDWDSVIAHNTQDILGLQFIYDRMTA